MLTRKRGLRFFYSVMQFFDNIVDKILNTHFHIQRYNEPNFLEMCNEYQNINLGCTMDVVLT